MIIKTAIQHRDRFIRTGLAHVLAMEPDVLVVGHVASAGEIAALAKDLRPDVVLLEIDADGWDGLGLAAALREVQRTLRIVGLHDRPQPDLARRAHQAGVHSTIASSAGTAAIVAALHDRDGVTPVGERSSPGPQSRLSLTSREIEILRCIATGRLTRETADELGIAMKTVENHKQRLFRKLDVRNQAHAVSIAIRRGVLAPATLASRA